MIEKVSISKKFYILNLFLVVFQYFNLCKNSSNKYIREKYNVLGGTKFSFSLTVWDVAWGHYQQF